MMRSRSLTAGETEVAKSVFGEAIDYSRVRLKLGKWWPLHPRGAAMAPMGHIYFHPVGGGWSEDFAAESVGRQAFFIHEMTHVWQSQKGGRFFLPLMRHPFCRYAYHLKPGKPFRRYGLEQQAELVARHFLANRGVKVAGAPPPDLFPFA